MANKLISILNKNTQPIYDAMKTSLIGKGYSYDDEKHPKFIIPFHAQIGSLYRKGGVAFYGRATNGWDDDDNDGVNSVITYNKSRFFKQITQISTSIYNKNPIEHIVWSNICKVAPNNGNPNDNLWDCQYDYMVEILKTELEILHPTFSIFITGLEHLSWNAPLFDIYNKNELKLVKHFKDDYVHQQCGIKVFYNANEEQYYLISGRPEFKDQESIDYQANSIVTFINSIMSTK